MSYDFSKLTPFLSDKKYDVFKSAYKDLRFKVRIMSYITIDSAYEANLPGLAFDTYGDTALWRAILYANGLSDPINDVVVGVRIALPEPGSLYAYLLRELKNNSTVVI